MKYWIFVTMLGLGIVSLYGQDDALHSAYDALLVRYVDEAGDVDYKGLKKEQAALSAYVTALAKQEPTAEWSRDAGLAYWINSYNAHTLLHIIKHYPVTSIMDLDKGKTWDVKWIKVGKKVLSLNDIEHEIIRKEYNEPRIHFAVNCAAASCPPLLNKAYTASSLEEQLESRTQSFINNRQYNYIKNGTVYLSKIFEWYAEDFGDLKSFLRPYNADYSSSKIAYAPYDWSLNKQ